MKLLLVFKNGSFIDSLGGAERVACNMANEMTRRGHEISILCCDKKSGMPAYPLDSRVKIINLNGTGETKYKLSRFQKLFRELIRPVRLVFPNFLKVYYEYKLWKTMAKDTSQVVLEENPDLIIASFYSDLPGLFPKVQGRSIPVIQMLHNPPVEAVPEIIRKTGHIFDQCQLVQVLRPEFVKEVQQFSKVPVVVIPNIVEQTDKRVVYGEKSTYRVIHIGRLDTVKRLDLLIRAFAKIAENFPNWTMLFFGSEYTPDYQNYLRGLISDLKMGKRIFLEGATQTPQTELLASDLFVIPSRQEGFGLALAEALSVGLPCIGYHGVAAVDGLIQDRINGLLAEPGIDGLANSMRELMSNADLREQYGRAGVESVRPYTPEKVWDTWEKIFGKVYNSEYHVNRPEIQS